MQLGESLSVGFSKDFVEGSRGGRVEDKAVTRESDARQHQVSPREPTESPVRERQAADSARHANAAMGRTARGLHEHFFCGSGRRDFSKVDDYRHRLSRRRHNHHVTAAADVARTGPGHRQGERRGDGRIDRSAATRQCFDADSRRERMHADHHAVLAVDEIARVSNAMTRFCRWAKRQEEENQSNERDDRSHGVSFHSSGISFVVCTLISRRSVLRITTPAAQARTSVITDAIAVTRKVSPQGPAGTCET